MHYLIDGHNLIGKMPDISLSDPDDEVQLVLRLRSWTAVSKKRQVTVYFDGGVPGGKNVKLSTSQVRVVFASLGRSADALIISQINQAQNPPEYLLITSDQEIIKAADGRKMKHLRSEKFTAHLSQQWDDTRPGATITDDDPVLSEAEVQDWLAAFGPVDKMAIRNRAKPIPPNRQPAKIEAEEEETIEPASNNREAPEMSERELKEWLELFGSAPKPQPQPQAKKKKKKETAVSPKRKKAPNPHNLKKEDLAVWQDFIDREK